jgi:hypothetical protein
MLGMLNTQKNERENEQKPTSRGHEPKSRPSCPTTVPLTSSSQVINSQVTNNQVTNNSVTKTQQVIRCGEHIFNSNFPSGNLAHVTQTKDGIFNLWVAPDPHPLGGGCRTWWYFTVRGPSPRELVRFRVVNLKSQFPLFKNGYRPVYSSDQKMYDTHAKIESENRISAISNQQNEEEEEVNHGVNSLKKERVWRRVSGEFSFGKDSSGLSNANGHNFAVSFQHRWSQEDEEVAFAFAIPYTIAALSQVRRCLGVIELKCFVLFVNVNTNLRKHSKFV